MLEPVGDRNVWRDIYTGYELVVQSRRHNGDPKAKFCKSDDSMSYWTLTKPSLGAEAQPVGIVLICRLFLLKPSPLTGYVPTGTIREAEARDRIELGMTMDFISREIALSPILFHEMFHAAMDESSTKLPLPDINQRSLKVLQCYRLVIPRRSTILKIVQPCRFTIVR
jgi:hypothetical protein